MFHAWSRRTKWLVSILAAIVIVVVIVLAVVLTNKPEHLGAIATDAAPCQEVGERLLRAGGNAVDVTIGILFCEGVSSSQSMGLGGGFIMTIYDRNKKESHILNAREIAPKKAFAEMFGNNSQSQSVYGGLAVAVPAEVVGYQEAHKKFGNLPWATLVEPTIKICEEGVDVIQYVANIMKTKESRIRQSPSLSELLIDPKTNQTKVKGDKIKRTKLAETLRVIAQEPNALHNGSLTKDFVAELQAYGSIITEDDMREYKPRWSKAVEADLPGGFKLIAPPPPGSGPLLAHFLKLSAGKIQPPLKTAEQYQVIIEALKFTYAARSDFGDPEMDPDNTNVPLKVAELLNQTFVDEIRKKIDDRRSSTIQDPAYYGAKFDAVNPRGTAHVSVITKDYAVSVTSTVNTEWGCMLVSKSTGIILNNEMDDFSLPGVPSNYGIPPSKANFIKPGKIPQSSMSPSVIVDGSGAVRLVIGASGGPRITSSMGVISLMHLYLGMDIGEAIRSKRIHHQLIPMEVRCEKGFSEDLMEGFRGFGHNITSLSTTASSVMAIAVEGNRYHPYADERREGVTALIES